MKKIKLSLVIVFSFFTISSIAAQYMWYENSSNTNHINLVSATHGTFSTDEINPETNGINSNPTVSKFVRDGQENPRIDFNLPNPITDFSSFTISLKAHTSIPTTDFTTRNKRIRLYLRNSGIGNSSNVFLSVDFTEGETWESFSFDFDGITIPADVTSAGGYDELTIYFAFGDDGGLTSTYYIDAISGSSDQLVEHPAAWLSGSWGVTFPVFGGERLDKEVARGYDLPSGAQEVVDELPAVGHIITNLSYFAHSHYFTLRGNNNVDVATEIHESLVPSLENEKIIFEVLQKFKDSRKRVILYISTNYLDRADDETQAAWVNYYTNEFAGNEYLAYKDLVEGFVGRVKDYADGYWLDTTGALRDDENLVDFIEMIRATDPSAAISVTRVTTEAIVTNFTDENGEDILVDSDGFDDNDDRDYRIAKFHAVNAYHDFTRGHVTSLASGAPPNSWAYEEFTIPAMVENPWSMFEGKTVLKHAWFPIRAKWHVPTQDLVFGIEDAYRFTKRIVNAGAGVTFATTINPSGSNQGYMMADEMVIMKEVNDRLLSVPMPEGEPYVRPEGACLVGEVKTVSVNSINKTDIKFYPNPVVNELTITRTTTDITYLQVISTMGTKVIEKGWDKGSTMTQLDLSTLNAGIYFIKLSTDNNQSITRKIIIAK